MGTMLRSVIALSVILFTVLPNPLGAEVASTSASTSTAALRTPIALWGTLPFSPAEADIRDLLRRLDVWSARTGSVLAVFRARMIAQHFGIREPSAPLSSSGMLPLAERALLSAVLPDVSPDLFIARLPSAGRYVSLFVPSATGTAIATRGTFARDLPLETIASAEIPQKVWVPPPGTDDLRIPPLLGYAPADCFAVYAPRLADLGMYARAIDETLGAPLEPWMPIGPRELLARILGRLGVVDLERFITLPGEALFIADNPSALLSDDIALVLRRDDETDGKTLFATSRGAWRDVGEYTILATSEELLLRVVAAAGKDPNVPSLAEMPDLRPVWKETDADGAVFAFFSERAAKRRSSPSEVVGSYRQALAVVRLEVLQYASFAYRSITGMWPASVETLFTERYLDLGAVASDDAEFPFVIPDFSIDEGGVVHHREWGTLYDIVPVGKNSVDAVSPHERIVFEALRYDPIFLRWAALASAGVSVTSNGSGRAIFRVLLPRGAAHPSIAPLGEIFGGAVQTLDPSVAFPAPTSVLLLGSFDVEHFMLGPTYGAAVRSSGSSSVLTLSDRSGERRDEMRHALVREFQEKFAELGVVGSYDPYALFGNTIAVGVGRSAPYAKEIFGLDGALSFRSPDVSSFGSFLQSLYAGVVRTFGEHAPLSVPEFKRLGGVGVAVFPFSFMNMHALLAPDRVYLSGSERFAASLFDGISGNVESPLSDLQHALAADVDLTAHLLLLADVRALDAYREGMIRNDGGRSGSAILARARVLLARLADAQGLGLVLGDGKQIAQYVPGIPARMTGLPVILDAERVGIGRHVVTEVSGGPTSGFSLRELYGDGERAEYLSALSRFSGIAASLRFASDNGVILRGSVPLAGLPLAVPEANNGYRDWTYVWCALGLAAALIVGWGIVLVIKKRRSGRTVAELLAEQLRKPE